MGVDCLIPLSLYKFEEMNSELEENRELADNRQTELQKLQQDRSAECPPGKHQHEGNFIELYSVLHKHIGMHVSFLVSCSLYAQFSRYTVFRTNAFLTLYKSYDDCQAQQSVLSVFVRGK